MRASSAWRCLIAFSKACMIVMTFYRDNHKISKVLESHPRILTQDLPRRLHVAQ